MTTQIEPENLQNLITHKAVKVIDGSWALDGTDMHTLFFSEHIPTAQFFDIEAISDHTSALPHMVPTSTQFAKEVGGMGISETDHVVIYDRQGLFSAARVWWIFRVMGHEKVQVLRGGLPAWKAAGLQVTAVMETPAAADYLSIIHTENVIQRKDLQENLSNSDYCILDARSRGRFEGTIPEPRAGLRSGHMPGSRNLPFGELLQDGALKPRDELKTIFEQLGVTAADTVVTTCGSGVTAAIISMALYEIGHTAALLYDGSWSEWGQETLSTPVATGAA